MSLASVLREYGEAFRGDWSPEAIDGRSDRGDMSTVADLIETGPYPGDEAVRNMLGICPVGRGHWSWLYCDEGCTAATPDDPAEVAGTGGGRDE